jgi:hypothetical protein
MSCGKPQSEPYPQIRFDGPHTGENDSTGHLPAEASGNRNEPAVINLSRVRNHAEQLATHLRSLREDLDRREAELNSREACSESDMRALRLWIESRQQQLREQTAELDQQTNSLREAADRLLANIDRDSLRDTSSLTMAELVFRIQSALKTTDRNLEHQRQELIRQRQQIELQQAASLAFGQRANVDINARPFFADETSTMDSLRQMDSDCPQFQQRLQQQWKERKVVLERRAAVLDRRQAALNEFRAEIADACRETMELHNALEQVWSQRSEASIQPAVDKPQNLKLPERDVGERKPLQRQLAELEEAENRLTQQYEKLSRERQEIQLSSLARMREIQRLERAHSMQYELWERERGDMQQQILELKSALQRKQAEPNSRDIA